MANRPQRLAHFGGRMRVQWVLLGLDRAAGAYVGPAGVALGDEAAGAGALRRPQEVFGAGRPQAVGELEPAVEVTQVAVAAQSRHLVNDDLRPREVKRRVDRAPVEAVHDDSLRAQALDRKQALRGAGGRGDLVPRFDQLRQETHADRPSPARDEDLHFQLLSSLTRLGTRPPQLPGQTLSKHERLPRHGLRAGRLSAAPSNRGAVGWTSSPLRFDGVAATVLCDGTHPTGAQARRGGFGRLGGGHEGDLSR